MMYNIPGFYFGEDTIQFISAWFAGNVIVEGNTYTIMYSNNDEIAYVPIEVVDTFKVAS